MLHFSHRKSPGAIGGAIVHDDDLAMGVGLRQSAVNCLANPAPAIVGGDNNADGRVRFETPTGQRILSVRD